jgi:hypothetical protein
LGLEKLQKPFSDLQQCATLKLSCDHFLEAVYSKYEEQTAGLVLYQGVFPKSVDPFLTRNELSDYLDILTANFPKALEMVLRFEPEKEWHPLFTYHLFHKEAFPRFKVEFPKKKGGGRVGILLPPPNVVEIESLISHATGPYRILYESELLNECNGIDTLICHLPSLSIEGKRVVAGFEAAEGQVVNSASFPFK